MPMEKTYNAATYTNKTSGFSLGTAFQFVGISAANQRNNSNVYIARDVDTVALHFPGGTGDESARFGWQFRPVLNRPAVESGTRQVFAVLSLPIDSTGIPTEDVS
jgi:hypothetical protein